MSKQSREVLPLIDKATCGHVGDAINAVNRGDASFDVDSGVSDNVDNLVGQISEDIHSAIRKEVGDGYQIGDL